MDTEPNCGAPRVDTMKRRKPNIRTFGSTIVLLCCLVLCVACSCRDREQPAPAPGPAPAAPVVQPPETSPTPPTTPTPAAPAPVEGETARGEAFLTAKMRVMSLSGEPLARMAPIATLQPNAFDKPIATGALTNAEGLGEIRFPAGQKVALRAWDPELGYFPNNFLEVMPNTGVITEVLEITMVRSGILFAVLKLPDGSPVRNENAGIMLFHPVYGPWWPSDSYTNDQGEVVFPSVPPGKFVLRLKIASGPSIEVAETYIAPGEPTPLGTIQLQ